MLVLTTGPTPAVSPNCLVLYKEHPSPWKEGRVTTSHYLNSYGMRQLVLGNACVMAHTSVQLLEINQLTLFLNGLYLILFMGTSFTNILSSNPLPELLIYYLFHCQLDHSEQTSVKIALVY